MMRALFVVLVALVAPALAEAQPRAKVEPDGMQIAARRLMLSAAHSWAYQLRITELAPLVASSADVLVVDHGYAARRNGKIVFDPADVAKLKHKGNGTRRIVLAYVSIGEAEQYRFYWQGAWCTRATAPPWIGAVNANWPGNYPVRFWDTDWQAIILAPVQGYLARIKAQGFDGIYLDRTDVYAEWVAENPHAERDMITFLSRIAATARADNPSFLVVMQNAEELLKHRDVRTLLDGVAKEDLLYGEKLSEAANAPDQIASSLKDLNRARADHMPVFAVEYLSDPAKIEAARAQLSGFGFIPTFAPRLLDRLVVQPGETAPLPAMPRPSDAGTTDASTAALPPGPAWAEGGPTCLLD